MRLTERKKASILIVDDDMIECQSLSEFLRLDGYTVDFATSAEDALDKFRKNRFDVVLTDANMPGTTGFDLLRSIKRIDNDVPVIIITGYGRVEGAVRAIKEGAYDYITKPLIDDGVKMIIARALEQQTLKKENVQLRQQLHVLDKDMFEIIARDRQMKKLLDLVESVADSRATITLSGESGVGKTLIARTIHMKSPRADMPFVEVSCGSLPESLLESELFGHTKGSFTGAIANKVGKFQFAKGGTVFLDDIGDAPPALQVKLLRVIQDRVFERVGDNKTIQADVRLIVATNKDLEEEVRRGRFREDLFYRVKVVSLHIPPLRDRIGDVKLLAEHFLKKHALENGKRVDGITPEAMRMMQEHLWPGNVRELENVIERAIILCHSHRIGPGDLPFTGKKKSSVSAGPAVIMPLKESLEVPEKQIILKALQSCRWSRAETAAVLEINRSTLFKKMRKYGLDSPEMADEDK